jgi:hypothetical protein
MRTKPEPNVLSDLVVGFRYPSCYRSVVAPEQCRIGLAARLRASLMQVTCRPFTGRRRFAGHFPTVRTADAGTRPLGVVISVYYQPLATEGCQTTRTMYYR